MAEEGLEVELVRESWSNVRDKLNIGLFDAAHLIAPVGDRVEPRAWSHQGADRGSVRARGERQRDHGIAGAHASIAAAADGEHRRSDGVGARAARVVANRKARGEEPLTFGMTFPFSTHNYHLRFWMAAGGVDPDEDVRLVVCSPPYMVESLANRHVDAFCVGAPWNSVAVDLGIGFILHFVSEILARATERTLGVRASWAQEHPDTLRRLVRAHGRAAAFVEDHANLDEVTTMLAAPNRIGAAAEVIRRTLDGRMKVAPDGMVRASDRYLLVGRKGAGRPDPLHAAWLYAQMVRWGRRRCRPNCSPVPRRCFGPTSMTRRSRASRPSTLASQRTGSAPSRGPVFDPDDIGAHLAGWKIWRT